jgi:single-strand DNA-binding protein
MNMFQFLGRLGADPEITFNQQGLAFTKVRIAVDKYKKGKGDGEWDRDTDWFSIDFVGDKAERLAAKYKKGRQILVTGTVHPWSQEKDGETKRGFNFTGKMFWYIDEKNRSSGDAGADSYQQDAAPSAAPVKAIIEDEIPF